MIKLVSNSGLLLFFVFTFSSHGVAEEYVAALQDITVHGESLKANEIDIDAQTTFVTVIERERFEGKLATVAEVLEKESGIQVRESGGLGTFSTVYLRGASAQQLNVYLDGVLLNNVVSGTVDLSRISLGQVESIEIYRGSPPIQLGNSAVGGAINIKTLDDRQGASELSIGYGSFESRQVDFSTQHLVGQFSLSAALGFLESDNDFSIVHDNGTPLNASDDVVEDRKNNDVAIGNGLLSVSYQLNVDQSLLARVQVHDKRQSIPDLYNSQNNESFLDSRLIQGQLQFSDNHWFDLGSYTVEGFWANNREHFLDKEGNIGVGLQDEVAKTVTYGVTTNANRYIGDHLMSVALTAKKEDYINENQFKLASRQDFVRKSLTFSLQDDVSVLSGNGLIVLGARSFWLRDTGRAPVDDTSAHVQLETVNFSDQYYSWRSGFRWSPNDSWTLKTNLSQAIRVPRLAERFGDRGLFKGNPELKEETAVNMDAGLTTEYDHSRWGATVFARWLEDAIVASYNSRRIGRFENVSKGEVYGAELTANVELTDWLSIDARTTLQQTENKSDKEEHDGKQLAGHYNTAHYLASQLQINDFAFLLEFQFEQGAYYDSPNSSAIPEKRQLDFTVKWQPKQLRNTMLRLEVNNLLDESYEAFNGYPAPGLHYFLSLKQKL